ncbi:hypothetical protein [Methylobacter sp.]|uniref:hypothetical protein n=1 Tax=Methylobacter sp. TaxID=2051955 RepID=UPI0011F8E003|nr:hypothetical protein [Methylobacter sp.]TAK65334.1 MAG: hypothetical protein EPO18_00145 [Methylobacter sp.]
MKNEILTIEQTYRGASNRIDNIPNLVKALNRWYLAYPGQNYLHPCVIDGKAALVCQRGLSNNSGQAFVELQAIADQYRIYLKEDIRTQESSHNFNNRRKNIGLVLTFCLGLMASSRLVTAAELQQPAASSVTVQLAMPINSMQAKVEVGHDGEEVISLRRTRLPTAEQVLESYAKQKPSIKIDGQAQEKIKNFLSAAYQPEPGDPANIGSDIADIAQYYAQYPQVIDLLEELQGKKLVLKYKANNWQAQAWGNEFSVDSVVISFDTRVGAQLLNQADCHANPACNISPADALLHELLHAKLMLIDSQHFIDSGGMKQTLYPFEHEREVIASENQLYHEMNQQDGLSRPLRHRHSGELFQVKCAACLPTETLAAN